LAQPCISGLVAEQPYGLATALWLERALAETRPSVDLGGVGLPV